jgi:hypothetical protein
MIWQQQDPILDVAVVDDQMIVLDTTSVTRYEHRERAGAAALNVTLPRDPRGRLEIAGESLTVHLPGATCRGTWKPLALACEPGGEFATGRNTIESSAWPPHYSRAHLGEDDLVAETDGRVHDYSARGPARIFDQWGSDLAAVCDTKRVLASGPGDRESRDFVALYELANGALASVSDPAEFPGPVTALSSSLAVTRNLSTGWYEAYSLTVDCGR